MEGKSTIQHDIEKDSEGPNIGCLAIIHFEDDFWGHVARSATKEIGFVVNESTETKINQFNLRVVEEYIFHFNIPMNLMR